MEKAQKIIDTMRPRRTQRLSVVMRRYCINGRIMSRASAISLLPSTKVPGGPQTRKSPPVRIVKMPPLTP